jgi:hypothetical protein
MRIPARRPAPWVVQRWTLRTWERSKNKQSPEGPLFFPVCVQLLVGDNLIYWQQPCVRIPIRYHCAGAVTVVLYILRPIFVIREAFVYKQLYSTTMANPFMLLNAPNHSNSTRTAYGAVRSHCATTTLFWSHSAKNSAVAMVRYRRHASALCCAAAGTAPL